MNKTWNNRAWFMVLPVLLLVAFSAVILSGVEDLRDGRCY